MQQLTRRVYVYSYNVYVGVQGWFLTRCGLEAKVELKSQVVFFNFLMRFETFVNAYASRTQFSFYFDRSSLFKAIVMGTHSPAVLLAFTSVKVQMRSWACERKII